MLLIEQRNFLERVNVSSGAHQTPQTPIRHLCLPQYPYLSKRAYTSYSLIHQSHIFNHTTFVQKYGRRKFWCSWCSLNSYLMIQTSFDVIFLGIWINLGQISNRVKTLLQAKQHNLSLLFTSLAFSIFRIEAVYGYSNLIMHFLIFVWIIVWNILIRLILQ